MGKPELLRALDATTTANDRKPSKAPPFSAQIRPDGLHGVAGDAVKLWTPHTEADPAAMLVQLLVLCGAAAGRTPGFQMGGVRHGLNENVVVVGRTSRARKGTSLGVMEELLVAAVGNDFRKRIRSGLSSGEGVIDQVRDPVDDDDMDAPADRRLVVKETEFASTLRQMQRNGNTLSAVLRQAWDGSVLSTLTRSAPLTASQAHVSVIGHITVEELLRELNATEQANGLGNRFLWVYAQRSKQLPVETAPDHRELGNVVERIGRAIRRSRQHATVSLSPSAVELWSLLYGRLTADAAGIFGMLVARGEAHVRRLAAIFAMLDQTEVVAPEHLRAAVAVWDYCEASIRFIFGSKTGDAIADRIRDEVERRGDLTRSQITLEVFNRNISAERIDHAVNLLLETGAIVQSERLTGGRPAAVFRPGANHA